MVSKQQDRDLSSSRSRALIGGTKVIMRIRVGVRSKWDDSNTWCSGALDRVFWSPRPSPAASPAAGRPWFLSVDTAGCHARMDLRSETLTSFIKGAHTTCCSNLFLLFLSRPFLFPQQLLSSPSCIVHTSKH